MKAILWIAVVWAGVQAARLTLSGQHSWGWQTAVCIFLAVVFFGSAIRMTRSE
jgi:hypothetical protein